MRWSYSSCLANWYLQEMQVYRKNLAFDLMPDWARSMHSLRAPLLIRPAVRGATLGLAGTLRWAFGGGVR